MHQPDQNEISLLLRQLDGEGNFATQRTASPGELDLTVAGFGKLTWPVTDPIARKLCKLAQLARHGYKTETRLDKKIRDTWEIKPEKLTVGTGKWAKALEGHLNHLRRDLGLPATCRLEAELHNLLIYTPGQFFTEHQDSVKNKKMIGTLVVVLPSRFSGGELVIQHQGESLCTRSSDQELTLIAFYADCRHELKPVKFGHRLALTYNLLVTGDTKPENLDAERLAALTENLRAYFASPKPKLWSRDQGTETPEKWVYLLDHQYTPRDLSWKLLKNGDAKRAAALRQIAEHEDYQIFLSLAEVQETWSYEEEEEDEDEADEDSLVLTELIERDIGLSGWIDAQDCKVEDSGSVSSHELFFNMPSDKFKPFRAEHEGYTGNAGNTADRWYHRIAIVIWPRKKVFLIRAKQNPKWALTQIAAALKLEDRKKVGELLDQLLPIWEVAVRKNRSADLLKATLNLVVKATEPEAFLTLLKPFSLSQITGTNVGLLVKTLHIYGSNGSLGLFRFWLETKRNEHRELLFEWMYKELPSLYLALCSEEGIQNKNLALYILQTLWMTVSDSVGSMRSQRLKNFTEDFTEITPAILAILDCSRITGNQGFQQEVIGFLTSPKMDMPESNLIHLLQAAHKQGRHSIRELGLEPLQDYCLTTLKKRMAEAPRTKDDWSIEPSLACKCELCRKLGRFLKDKHEQRMEWPLAKENRQHMHQIIDSNDFPVMHTTRRTGSPFTLILEKTKAIFSREEKMRANWKKQLDCLSIGA